jgi:phage-related holin
MLYFLGLMKQLISFEFVLICHLFSRLPRTLNLLPELLYLLFMLLNAILELLSPECLNFTLRLSELHSDHNKGPSLLF